MFGLFKKKKDKEERQSNGLSLFPASYYAPTRSSEPVKGDNGSDFGTSMLVGMATHSPILGMAVGGSIMGGIIGAETSISNDSSSVDTGSCDSSSNYDSGSSYGCDSGSSSGDF